MLVNKQFMACEKCVFPLFLTPLLPIYQQLTSKNLLGCEIIFSQAKPFRMPLTLINKQFMAWVAIKIKNTYYINIIYRGVLNHPYI